MSFLSEAPSSSFKRSAVRYTPMGDRGLLKCAVGKMCDVRKM